MWRLFAKNSVTICSISGGSEFMFPRDAIPFTIRFLLKPFRRPILALQFRAINCKKNMKYKIQTLFTENMNSEENENIATWIASTSIEFEHHFRIITQKNDIIIESKQSNQLFDCCENQGKRKEKIKTKLRKKKNGNLNCRKSLEFELYYKLINTAIF